MLYPAQFPLYSILFGTSMVSSHIMARSTTYLTYVQNCGLFVAREEGELYER